MGEAETTEMLHISGPLLDRCLALGYYRLGSTVFTADEYWDHVADQTHPVFWLRTVLSRIEPPHEHKVFKRNRQFTVSIGKAKFNKEINHLYSVYRERVKFDAPPNIDSFLFGNGDTATFDSKSIEVRDGRHLIAVGYFDEGEKSIMGNMNFYDPDYGKFSLGKYLMLLKMQYAIEKGMEHYYTGYIALTNNKFDYKLFPNSKAIEVYLPQMGGVWRDYDQFGKDGLKLISGNVDSI